MKAFVLLCLVAVALAVKEPQERTCLEEPDDGMCRGYFPMYYYDPKTQTCKEFVYGGCQGNGNRYATEEECLDNCRDVVAWEASEELCNLPAETGMCRAYFPRFYFDKTTGQCQKFVYGGCGGNENNFGTIEECEQRCGKASASSPCDQEKVVGPCKAGFRRYYFNKESGECELFLYGGCLGNENNFKTKEDCEAVCVE